MLRNVGHLKSGELGIGVLGHVITGEHGDLIFSIENHVNDVRVVINAVVRCRIGSPTQRPRRRIFHDVPPLSGAKPVLTSDDDDVAVVWNVRTDDILADGEGDGFRINIPAHVNPAGRGATCLGLNGLHRARLARATDGDFPRPIGMNLGVGAREHGGSTVGGFTLVDVNLDDLVAEAVGQPPNVGHLAHGENELGVPGTLTHREVSGIPKASTAGCVEVGRQRVHVIAISGFIPHGVIQFKQGDPFLKIGKDHFSGSRRGHLSIGTITVGQRIAP